MSLLSVRIEEAGYELDKKMIQDIRFQLDRGELVGIIGANGAGKSTTIKSILGLMPFINGKIEKQENLTVSYLPEHPVFYDELTLQEHIDFVAAVEGISDEQLSARTLPLLEKFNLKEHVHEVPGTYSKGMRQKAMIILALMKSPDILIVDEPFIGLDPVATKLLLDLINEERQRGTGILMSTHVLDTAEKICNRFLLIDNGCLTAQGTLLELQEQCGGTANHSLLDCFHHLTVGEGDE